MTDGRFERARERIKELQRETRQYLAEQLGGDPEDYRHDTDEEDDSE